MLQPSVDLFPLIEVAFMAKTRTRCWYCSGSCKVHVVSADILQLVLQLLVHVTYYQEIKAILHFKLLYLIVYLGAKQ